MVTLPDRNTARSATGAFKVLFCAPDENGMLKTGGGELLSLLGKLLDIDHRKHNLR